MGKRASVKHAEYSFTRAECYKTECDKILFDRKWSLRIDGAYVYLKTEENEVLLHQIIQPKSLWFEVWLQLKDSNKLNTAQL